MAPLRPSCKPASSSCREVPVEKWPYLDGDGEVLISPQQLQSDLAFWIEGYDSRERRHSTIDNLSPMDYEQQFIAARTLTYAEP